MPKNKDIYSSEEQAKITKRIEEAMKKYGHTVADEGNPPKDIIVEVTASIKKAEQLMQKLSEEKQSSKE